METGVFSSARATGQLWEAVQDKPMDGAIAALEKEGWARVRASKGELTAVVLKKEASVAVLYVRDGRVGMIERR